MNLKGFIKQSFSDTARILLNKKMRLQSLYAKYYQYPINEETVLYEVRDGESIVDSPFAIFNYLIEDNRFKKFHHIWVINDEENPTAQALISQFSKSVTLIKRNSKDYMYWLATAKYLINNATFQPFFSKREEQVYINTWHGTPLKLMGFDIPGDPSHSYNVLRNFLMADFILSPNAHTSQIFSKSYHLDGLYAGKILEGGYPRIDTTLNTSKSAVVNTLKSYGIRLDESLPTILYTPTWKGTSITNPSNDQEQIIQESLLMKNRLSGKYNFLVKVHPYLYKKLENNSKIEGMLIPDSMDANFLMAGIDLLITDYSSIFFDYLVTDQPVIFYAWDRDLYQNQRGMYLSEDELPGPIVENVEDLLITIENLFELSSEYRDVYNSFKTKFTSYDDGHTTERYVNRIFFNQTIEEINEISLINHKVKLLIYPGRLKKNGITSSFMNLLQNIDFEQYDISILLGKNLSDEEKSMIVDIPNQVRLLFAPGGKLYKKIDYFKDDFFKSFGDAKFFKNLYPKTPYYRDARRITGGVLFDVAIDFSGYSFYWAKIICGVPALKRIIYQHNDLLSESEKIIDGKKVHKNNLSQIFLLYRYFDRILSVSKETMELNGEKLFRYVKPAQLGYANNLLNIDKILSTNQTDKSRNEVSFNTLDFRRYTAEIEDTGNYLVAKDLNNLIKHKFNKIKVVGCSKVYVLATTIFQEKQYAKVTINGVYVGWVDSEILNVKTKSDTKVKRVCLLATISKSNDGYIYFKPKENSKIVSPLKYLEKTYVGVNKIATTELGIYYLIQTHAGEIGWVEQKYVTNIHNMRKFSLLRQLILNKNKVLVSQEFDEKLREAVVVTKPKIILSDNEQIIPRCLLKINLSDSIGNKIMLTKRIVVEGNELFLTNLHSRPLWISSDAVEVIRDVSVHSTNEDKNKGYLTDINGEIVPNINSDNFNIVTMGRLSPEKNQINLIKAFKQLTNEYKKLKLFILGDGNLKNEIQELIAELNLENSVYLLGHKKNPFSIMKECNLFVLPSIYEGQPMVLLEALTLGMNVIATDIPANRSVLKNNYGGYIRGTDVSSLVMGIKSYLDYKITYDKFDPYAYNRDALEMFYKNLK